ncbi:hypothetical protein ACJX0J_040639, partial [Zea mays]
KQALQDLSLDGDVVSIAEKCELQWLRMHCFRMYMNKFNNHCLSPFLNIYRSLSSQNRDVVGKINGSCEITGALGDIFFFHDDFFLFLES